MPVKDKSKLVIIAQAYSHLKGNFSSKELYNFIKTHDFGFRSEPTVTQIGAIISRSKKFQKVDVENSTNIFRVRG